MLVLMSMVSFWSLCAVNTYILRTLPSANHALRQYYEMMYSVSTNCLSHHTKSTAASLPIARCQSPDASILAEPICSSRYVQRCKAA